MASNESDIINLALIELGQKTITERTDQQPEAIAANIIFDSIRDEVLRAGKWNCAATRASLNKLVTKPVWGFSNEFQLPTDWIRLISTEDLGLIYRIEHGPDGRVLASDASSVNIYYVRRLEDVTKMDDGLTSAIAALLAARLAIKLTGEVAIKREMETLYQSRLGDGRFYDAVEGPVEVIEGRTWVDAREGDESYRFRTKLV